MSSKREWVIEEGVFEENEDKLKEILGDRLVWAKYTINGPTFSKSPVTPFTFYGTSLLGRRLKSEGAICWLDNRMYDCNYYLPFFGKMALNNPHMFVESGTFPLLAESLSDIEWFVKQNCGYKSFTGTTCVGAIDTGLFPEELLLLAPKKPIDAEWRFIIRENSVLTYSAYGDTTEDGTEAKKFAETCLSTGYDPAPMWVLDICRSNGVYKVLEVNALLSSGWYDCDVKAIVEAVDEYN